jgi:hypothetical protein
VSKTSPIEVFAMDTLVNGQPARIDCARLGEQVFELERGALTVARLHDEWFHDIGDAPQAIAALRSSSARPDLLTFVSRLHDPRLDHTTEWEQWAVLPVTTHEHWWNHQIKSRVRSQIRKAQKDGLVVKEMPFNDDFVRGMTEIFNESPVRQGRSFWHYGKDFETVKAQFSRYNSRERMIGAYVGDKMVGFMMLANAGRFALPCQILSSLHSRDLQPTTSMMAKAVELCEAQGLSHLVYFYWSDDSLSEFKRRCGFEPVAVPRYYVPLTLKGRLALRVGAHRGWKAMLPQGLKQRLKGWRRRWNERHAQPSEPASQTV